MNISLYIIYIYNLERAIKMKIFFAKCFQIYVFVNSFLSLQSKTAPKHAIYNNLFSKIFTKFPYKKYDNTYKLHHLDSSVR